LVRSLFEPVDLLVEPFADADRALNGQSEIRIPHQLRHVVGFEGAQLVDRKHLAEVASEQVLEREKTRSAFLHEAPPPTKEITVCAILRRVDGASRQDSQTQEMSEPTSVVPIVGVLEALVLAHRRGVDQRHLVPVLHQAIDQPVPVVG
jgi:hypothetical protein